MFASLLILLVLPFTDLARIRGNHFKPLSRFTFWTLVTVFFILMWIGARHADAPYIFIGQVATGVYFGYFLILVPVVTLLENSLVDIDNRHEYLELKSQAQSGKINSIYINSIFLGIKKGYEVDTLPANYRKFLNLYVVRIMRFICGLCLMLVLTKYYLNLPKIFHNWILVLGVIQSIFIIFTIFTKIIYGLYTLIYQKKKLEVRNSPINLFASRIGRAVYCFKVGCAITGGTAATIAAGVSFDTVLEQSGRPKIFVPLMAKVLNTTLGTPAENITEVTKDLFDRTKDVIPEEEAKITVQTTLNHYKSLSDEDKLKFLEDINNNYKKEK